MNRYRKLILIVVVLAVAFGGYIFLSDDSPEEMLPTPLFSELCDFDAEGLAAQHAAYRSRATEIKCRRARLWRFT